MSFTLRCPCPQPLVFWKEATTLAIHVRLGDRGDGLGTMRLGRYGRRECILIAAGNVMPLRASVEDAC